ncbi:Cnl2/NKP2 family protein-domain-containing protein [Tirmania nivea]|nr:Cnl2/NKP2 family protein-domain-containing protein [Tirmania nivea]
MSHTPASTPDPTKTEYSLLTSYLLSRAPLPEFLPLPVFTNLFPLPLRSNPQIRLLYRQLQLSRTQTISRVKKNIDLEICQSKRQLQRLRQSNSASKSNTQGLTGDAMVGVELFGTSISEPVMPLAELLVQMEDAVVELAEEERRLEEECNKMMKEMQEWVGGLSDLIYGKFSTPGIEGKVIEQLENLEETCEGTLDGGEE